MSSESVSHKSDRPIALFCSNLRGAGVQKMRLNLASGFMEHGHKVDLVLVNSEGELRNCIPSGVRVIDLQSRHTTNTLPSLIRYLRETNPVALLSAQTHLNLVSVVAKSLAHSSARLIISEHNAIDLATKNSMRWKDQLLPAGARLLYPRANKVVVVSKGAAEQFIRTTGVSRDLVQVVYNPVVTPELLEQATQPLQHPWFQKGQPAVILSVGRLTHQKDHATLIRAFNLFRKVNPARLMILGEGEERGNLQKLVQDLGLQNEVSLPGFMPNPYNFMLNARMFVLSSLWEGLANVIIEAMACGTPIVSTDCPSGPAEILEDGRWGILVQPGNPEALADAMQKSLNSTISAEDRKSHAMQFSLETIVPQYLEVLLPQ